MNRRLRHGPTRQSARSFGYKGTCKKPRYFYGTYYHIRGVYSKYTLLKTATDCLRLHVVSGLLRWRGDGADDVGEFASGAKLYGIAESRDFRMRVRGGGGRRSTMENSTKSRRETFTRPPPEPGRSSRVHWAAAMSPTAIAAAAATSSAALLFSPRAIPTYDKNVAYTPRWFRRRQCGAPATVTVHTVCASRSYCTAFIVPRYFSSHGIHRERLL